MIIMILKNISKDWNWNYISQTTFKIYFIFHATKVLKVRQFFAYNTIVIVMILQCGDMIINQHRISVGQCGVLIWCEFKCEIFNIMRRRWQPRGMPVVFPPFPAQVLTMRNWSVAFLHCVTVANFKKNTVDILLCF